MSDDIPPLRARLFLDTSSVGEGLASARGQIRAFGSSVGAGLSPVQAGVAGVGLAVAVVAKQVIGAGIAYQDSLNTFQSVSGATAAEMREVSKTAVDLGNDLELPGVSAADAATTMTELAKAGLSVAQSQQAARGTMQLAIAGNLDFATAAGDAANALNEFGLSGDQASHVADVLAGAANSSSGEVGDFANALNQVGLVADSADQSLETTVGALALFAQRGLQGQDAGTSFKTALLALRAPTSTGAAAIKEYGLQIRDTSGHMRPLTEIAQDLHGKLGALNEGARDQALYSIFGSDAIRVGTILTQVGSGPLQKMIDQVSKEGSAAAVAAAKSKGLGGAVRGLGSELETLELQIFQKVAPGLEAFVRKVANDLPVGISAAGAALTAVGHELAPIGPALRDLADAGENVVRDLAPAGKVLGEVVGAGLLVALHGGALALEGIAHAIDEVTEHKAAVIGIGAALAAAFAGPKIVAGVQLMRELPLLMVGVNAGLGRTVAPAAASAAAMSRVGQAGLGIGTTLKGGAATAGSALAGILSPAKLAAAGVGLVIAGAVKLNESEKKLEQSALKAAEAQAKVFNPSDFGKIGEYNAAQDQVIAKTKAQVEALEGYQAALSRAQNREISIDPTGNIPALIRPDDQAALDKWGKTLSGVGIDVKEFGGSLGAVQSSLTGYRSDLEDETGTQKKFNDLAEAAARAMHSTPEAVAGLINSYHDLTGQTLDLNKPIGDLIPQLEAASASARGASPAAEELTTGMQSLGDTVGSTTDQLKGLQDVLDALTGSPVAAERAFLQMRDAVVDAGDAVAKNGRTLDENTAAGRANREAIEQVASAAASAAEAQFKANGDISQATKTYAEARDSVIKLAEAAGQSPAAAEQIADSYGLIPDRIAASMQQGQPKVDAAAAGLANGAGEAAMDPANAAGAGIGGRVTDATRAAMVAGAPFVKDAAKFLAGSASAATDTSTLVGQTLGDELSGSTATHVAAGAPKVATAGITLVLGGGGAKSQAGDTGTVLGQYLATEASTAVEALSAPFGGSAKKFIAGANDALPTASTTGETLGQALAAGVASGLNAGKGAAASALNFMNVVSVAAQKGGEIKSPSRRWAREIGLPLAQGLAVGLASGSGIAQQAARTVVGSGIGAARTAMDAGLKGLAADVRQQIVSAGQVAAGASSTLTTGLSPGDAGAALLRATQGPVPAARSDLAGKLGVLQEAIGKARTAGQTDAKRQAAEKSARAAVAAAQAQLDAAKKATTANKTAVAAAQAQLDAAKKVETGAKSAASSSKEALDQAKSGLTTAAKDVTDSQAALADAVTSMQDSITSQFVDTISSSIDAVLSKVTDLRQAFAQSVKFSLADSFSAAFSDADSTLQQVASAQAKVNALVAQFGGTANLTATQTVALAQAQQQLAAATAAATAAGVGAAGAQAGALTSAVADLQTHLAEAVQFKDDLTQLQQAGLSAAEIQDIAGSGLDTGLPLAEAILASGQSTITTINGLVAQLGDVTDHGADQLSADIYGDGVKQLLDSLDGIAGKFPDVDTALSGISTDITTAFGGLPDQLSDAIGKLPPAHIDASTVVTIQGNVDSGALGQLEAVLQQHNADLLSAITASGGHR